MIKLRFAGVICVLVLVGCTERSPEEYRPTYIAQTMTSLALSGTPLAHEATTDLLTPTPTNSLEASLDGKEQPQGQPMASASSPQPEEEGMFELVFQDDFSDENASRNSKWLLDLNQISLLPNIDTFDANFVNEALQVDVDFASYYIVTLFVRDEEFMDFRAEFDATFISVKPTSYEADIAFVLPKPENQDYYVIFFDNFGNIELAEYDCPYRATCNYVSGANSFCDAKFELDNNLNHFSVVGIRGDYKIYVNGMENPVCDFYDEDLASLVGSVALGVRGQGGASVSVVFDNVELYTYTDLP